MFFKRIRQRHHRHPLGREMRWLRMLIVFVVFAGAGISGGVLVGFLSAQGPVEALERYDPPQVTRLFDRTGQIRVADFFSEKRHVLALSDMPSALRGAFVAIEDERFYEHFGADPQGILRALLRNLQAGQLREGGSTITQQMTRN
ncbi:MAG: transglycosylase domain-containing protein, partial [Candidatus Sumerlaeota bacterium]